MLPCMALLKPMLTGFASKCIRFVAPIWNVLTWVPSGLIASDTVLAQDLALSRRMLPE